MGTRSALGPYVISGPHFGAARKWIQRNCGNGSVVKWGSDEALSRRFTARDIDELAIKIAEAVNPDKEHDKELIEDLRKRVFLAEAQVSFYKEKEQKTVP